MGWKGINGKGISEARDEGINLLQGGDSMRKLAVISTIVFMLPLFAIISEADAQSYIETFENGKIDWSKGVAEAIGIGAPPKKPINMAQARAMAKRAAVTVARRNLLEILKGVRVTSTTLVKDAVVRNDMIRTKVKGFLDRSHVADIAYMSDGSVEATVKMSLKGGFANLVLPESIKTIQPIGQSQAEAKGTEYTGLVIDCRGFLIKPALSPKVVDESGNEVYGSVYVSREYATSKGMVGYAKDLAAAQKNQRVADNPLTVKGIRTAESGDSDIVISNADAALIRGAAENLSFLKQCKVMIVLD